MMLIKRLFFLLFLASAVTGGWHALKAAPGARPMKALRSAPTK